jgi:hypothetical protein
MRSSHSVFAVADETSANDFYLVTFSMNAGLCFNLLRLINSPRGEFHVSTNDLTDSYIYEGADD